LQESGNWITCDWGAGFALFRAVSLTSVAGYWSNIQLRGSLPGKNASTQWVGVAGSPLRYVIHPLKISINENLLMVCNPPCFWQITDITAVISLQKNPAGNMLILPSDSRTQVIKKCGHIRKNVKTPEKIRSPQRLGVAGFLLRHVIHPL
jgi:hypothetical protein